MVQIGKTIQAKHLETLSPWLKDFAATASTIALPLLPRHLAEFPTRWPFPRGDLYHWIVLLNRFDLILELFIKTYELKDGPQSVEFGRKVLESTKKITPDAPELLHGESSESHDLNSLSFGKDGDRQLIESILNFSRMLLENCGNRSLYGSSSYLDSLLNTTSLSLLESTLLLSSQLAQRYSTAAKRGPARLNQAVLNSHYSIDLDKVQQLAQPFSKTVVIPAESAQPTTPVTPSAKGKEKAYFSTPATGQKGSTTTVYANDIVSLAKGGVINASGPKTMRSRGIKASVQASNTGWETWGDVRLSYYPKISAESEANSTPRPSAITPSNNVPTTPTPIRRASNLGPHGQRANRTSSVDESPAPASRSSNFNADEAPISTVKTVEITASEIKAVGLHALLRKYCAGLPSEQQYELLTKLRAADALTTSLETRRHLLSVRLLAITNMAYIHSESAFAENILKQDSDEPRRLQLVPQLAELIHPPAESEDAVPRHLQTLALSTLTAIAVQHTGGAKFQDVCSALNANVNHGVLLYVIRKAVAEMSDNESVDEIEQDDWRDALFELIFNIALVPRTATDLVTAGVIPIFVEVLSLRNPVAERYYPKIVSFLDNLVYSVREAFQVLVDAGGLDVVSILVVDQVKTASKLAESSEGIQPEYKSPSLDYEIRYYQQQTLKWVFKFIHHMMTSSGTHGGNSERLLRNLVDSSQLLGSLKQVIQNSRIFGSIVWTNAIMILNDFINNEPTSFTIILEAGLSKAVLEAVTGRPVTMPSDLKVKEPEEEQNPDASSPASSEDTPTINADTTPHPPTQESLQIPRSGPLAQGIMPSTDAILILPQAFNAMCLSTDGMKLFLASKALDSFFEIFESPEHVKCLSSNMFSSSGSSVTSQLGSSFDELVRHHPKLKTFIVNAVLDMVARVAYLCKITAEGGKIGARLLTHLPTAADAKGKGKAVEEATDVEMMDIDSEPEGISPLAQAETPDKNSMTPYIAVVAQFLHTLFSNTSVATEFSTRGGVEYLLDFADSPCLPCAFVQSQITNSTSNTLNICIAELADKKPHLVIPSLLKRAQVAADTLAPFAKKSGNESFFKQFIIPKDLNTVTRDQCAQGTKIVKALVAIDSVVTILQRALKSDYGVPRSFTTNFHTLNFNDYYARLVRSLGDLLGASVSEGLLLEQIIPQHWNEKEDRSSSGPSLEAIPETEPTSPAIDAVAIENEQTGTLDQASKSASQAKKKMTKEEKDSLHYKNYQTLKYLLGHMSKAISPFFQTLGKVLISKRNQGAFQRQSQTEIAVALAETLLHLLNDQPQERSVEQLKYWHAILKVLSKTLVDHPGHADRPPVQTITLVLQAFKDRGGFDTVNHIIEVCSKEIESSTNDEDPIRSTSIEILNHVLPVYTHVVSGKAVTEASQSALLGSGRQVADKAKSDYFSPQQFLVELRMAVFPAIRHLWEASPVDKTPSSTWSTLISVIRAIAQADHELGANKRSEKIGPTVQASRDYFKPNSDHLISLLDDAEGDEELVKEALYRCANNVAPAREYIKDMRADRNSGRNPIPPSDVAAEVPSTPRPRTSTSAATSTPDFNDQEMEVNSLPELDLSRPTTSDQQAERERIVQSFAASQQTPIAPEDPKIKRVTVEDLDEERSSIRENLVDRCLEIIYRHGEVTFDVADLLTTFVGKVHDQMDFRREIGTSVMAVLQSYETLEDISDKGKEVAAAAHLLGLMLQDKPFYEATVELLRESIPTMLTYIKLSPSHSAKNPSPWISQVLLIIETLLRTDERPRKTKFKMPKSEQDTIDTPVLEKKEFTISREERLQLLESILEILPRVGMAKDEVLALAVLRILVILTRDRPVAQTMGEKKNIQRLFAMAKQLAGSSSARIHGQLMLILRHIIEDEETIKQIMRSEIKAVFESHRHPRNVDVTNYLRTLSAQALRAPELFIEVTNEMVKFGRWTYPASDVPSRPNYLVLKEVDTTEKSVDDSVQPTVQATEDLSIQDVKPSTEGEDSEMGEASKLPAPEQKAPAVENPDGVIHFLLCELLNYRDVEDLDPSIAANATAEKTAATTSITDTDMSGTSTTDTPLKKDEKSSKVPGKQDFKSEEHPIYIYRCFILQCLTELLSSYNRTKIEFINFKRSAPQLAMTPSKPRSSVINYLLSDLIPVGTLEHAETTALRKRFTTSSWADSVLTALLSKTGEQPVDKARELSDGDDEPDLQFVRRFVLENILRAFKEASASSEPLEVKYARMLSLADLMGHIMSGKGTEDRHSHDALTSRNHAQLRRLMFEKGYIAALTSSIAEIDLNFPNAKRAVKYILRPLKTLTHTAQTLSELGLISTPPGDGDVDDIESATSVSDVDDDREETPDLFRNSTLGMFEAGGEEESSSSDDDDEEMYEGEYDEEGMDYDEEMEEDDEDNISDEDEDFEGMGPIEGLDGDHAMDIEVTMDEAEDIESAGSDEEEEDDDDDDEEDSDDDDARVEIIDELGNVHDAGDEDDEAEEWESDDDEEDYDGQAADQEEARAHMDDMQNSPLGHLVRALGGDDHEGAVEILQRMEDEGLDEGEQIGEYLEDVEDEDEEDEEDDMVDEEMLFDSFPDGPPPFAWDEADPPMVIGHRRPRGLQSLPIFHGGPRDPLGGMSHSPTSPLGFEDPILARRLETAVDNLRSASSRLRAVVDRIVGLRLNSQVFLESQHQSILDNIMSHVTNDEEANPHSVVPDYRSTYRSHRPGQPPRSADDGTNPLLQRANSSGTSSHAAARAYPGGWVAPAGLDLLDIGLGGRHSYGESPAALLNDLIRTLPMPGTITRGGQALQFHITGHGEMPRDLQAMFGIARGYRSENRRDNVDPGSATSFNPQSTTARWTEEAKILFGSQHHEVTADITMALNAVLVPPAIEADKAFKAAEAERIRKAEEEAKKRAEEERIAKEAKEAEERIAREKKEAEEREAAEKAAAESAAARGLESDQNESGEPVVTETETDAMDTTSDAGPSGDGEEAPASDRPRVTTQIRGQSFDITDLGIDADFLAELPEELREEVIMSAVAERRSQAAATGAQPSDIDQDFLDALPDDIRDEIIQQERQDRRRRERDEQRRQAAANGGRDPALDMDPASILATLPPALRQQVLMEQDEDMINQLPPDLAAQARAFQREDRIHQGRVPMAARRTGGPAVPEATGQRPVRRPVVQMLDKPGVATLLRLMFVLQQGTLRSALNSVLQYVSNNKQNRSDVISTLLHILQDGSADMSAVERSFAHLSLKAKQPKDKDPKTPTTLKRTLTSTSTSGVLAPPTAQINSEASPLMVVQQCLHVLTHLSQFNPHVPSFFLTEHGNVAAGLKRTLSRKGKGKESEATKYALNSLLCLLDRDLIMESSTVMESLSALLNMTTQPLPALDRKQKEAVEEAKKARENATAESQAVTEEPVAQPAEIAQTNESASGVTAPVEGSAQPDESAANTETTPAAETAKDADKKIRPFTPPVVPDYNLKLVINIFVARECSRKTFQETISTIKNLSVIPGAKSVFGRELITKAQELGEIILGDLQQLLPQIQKATTSTEIQGLALAKFSPTSSDQNKLLRVLTALDHLFDPKLNKDKNTSQDDGESAEKQDLLSSLYENSTFGPMWGKLSACLSAIRQREHMLNVATILLPLIESLMVVCKNTTLKDAPISRSQLGKEMMLTSPPPESRMESLFFTFTEEHRKILNDLVRQNPKLMSGTFSLLVKNPKVLEFDNKRNYFGRSIRERNPQARQSYPPLQLSVRRDQVFHDSFKSLYFQTGDQMKYGKLSIRFHGEEGVDAGGVTREWFQVLSRQMFEPGYALFIPVSSDRTTFHPNQLSSINEEHLMFFKFIGRIIGKALYENRVLDCHFSRAVYKAILGKQISLKDMESLDPEYYKSLVWMLENDITDIITETFSVDNDKFGVIETIDFIPNGRNTPVTEENKHEYVRLMVEFKLTGSVKAQLDEFLKGFHEIIPAELVAIFNEQELELLISGLPEIDVDDWKSNTEYHNYSGASPQIQWFWRAVRSYDKEERAKLLQFVTGTSKVPLNGFKELEGMNGFSRFNIHRDYGNKDRLPSSHTCFNQLDLPEYESYDVLRQQVLTAITAGSEYFGFA